MFSSTRQKIVCVLILLSTAALAYSQTAPAKEATGVVSGKVSIKGKPAPGIVVLLRPYNMNSTAQFPSYKVTTDLNGEYRIANVVSGNYLVTTLAPAFVDPSGSGPERTLLVSKGETIEHIDFDLVRGGVITGKIVDADGRPVVEQPVLIFAAGSNQYSQRAIVTDDRGIYRFYGLKAGGYKVATGQGERGSFSNRPTRYKQTYYPSAPDVDQAAVVEVSEGGETANIDITLGPILPTYTASGKIVDGETGQPLAGVGYGVMRFLTSNNTSSTSNGAVSNSRGEFTLQNLIPGKYAVQIRPGPTNTWRAEDVRFEIVDEDVSGLVVQTKKGALLSGVVVVEGDDDKSVRNELKRVSLLAISGMRDVRPATAWSMIGSDGSFSMSGVAAGTSVFQVANSSRFRIVRVERNGVVQAPGVEVKEGEVINGLRVFLVYGSATIRGAIELTNGTVPAGARFSVWLRNLAEDPQSASSSNYSVDVDARGQFVVEGVFPGMYEISAGIWSADGRTNFAPKKQQIAVSAGSVSNITLSVDANSKTTRP